MPMEILPPYQQLKNHFKITPSQNHFVEKSRETLRAILRGEDQRLLLIVGPCSIHHLGQARDYALRLKELSDKVCSHFFIIMRAYFEKPRSLTGWKGFLYDPLLDGSHQMGLGIELTRQLLLELAELEIPAGT